MKLPRTVQLMDGKQTFIQSNAFRSHFGFSLQGRCLRTGGGGEARGGILLAGDGSPAVCRGERSLPGGGGQPQGSVLPGLSAAAQQHTAAPAQETTRPAPGAEHTHTHTHTHTHVMFTVQTRTQSHTHTHTHTHSTQ